MLYITLRQLEYVVAVSKAGSLTDAANLLNVSQPALSVAITQVENHLGQKLFIRRKGVPVTLSSHGSGFVAEAEELLAHAARLEDPRALANRRRHRIVVGCFEDIAPSCLAPVLHHLGAHMPDVAVVPRVAEFEALAGGMLDGRIDLSITYDLGLDASFERTVLSTVAPYAFVAPDDALAGCSKAKLKDLAARPLILFDQGLSIRHMLQLFKGQRLRPRVVHRTTSLEVMRSLAANGEGVGISYTNPPSGISYDGKPVCAVKISDPEALEPIILARSGLIEPTQPIPAVIEALQGLEIFSQGEAQGR